MFINKRKSIIIYFTLSLIVFLSTFVVWLPFLLKISAWFGLQIENSNFMYIYKHYDGPLYIVAAKSFYNPEFINSLKLEMTDPAIYFAAHLPLYPLFIRLFSFVFGYLKSMILVNVFFTILLTSFFYFAVKNLKLSRLPFVLAIIFLFLPRFMVIRSIGAPESLFILLILLSLYFFEKNNYLLAGIFGGLSVMTKTPGILLFPAYSLVIVERFIVHNRHSGTSILLSASGVEKSLNYSKKRFLDFARNDRIWQWLYLLLIPLGLLGVFVLYGIQYGDFWAYFHSGDNIHLVFPFSVFNFQAKWVGTAWLEDIIFYFFIYLMAVFQLRDSKYRSLFYFGLVFFIATIFVQHRDISRYSLPLWPLACIAFSNFFTSKKFLIAFIILLPAIYLYAWNFLLYNVMPIGDWRPFL